MCLEMDAKVECEVLKSCYSRRSGKLSKCRLRKLLSLSPGQEGLKMWRANVVKATLRKYTRCEQKRRLIAKLVNQQQHACSENREMLSGTEAGVVRDALPVCAMAPENTTQYLMDIVYDDMLIDTSSRTTTSYGSIELSVPSEFIPPVATCDSSDCAYESSLDFQQRDFEEMYLHFGSC